MNLSNSTVFIVDDDNHLHNALGNYLRTAGLQVESYSSAEAYLQAFDPDQPGCLVLDLRMPGMGGLALQSYLASQGHTIPVIIVTGYADIPVTVRSIQAGAVVLLEKPFKSAELLAHIHDAFERDRANRVDRRRAESLSKRVAQLTSREREVMGLLARGHSNAQVAVLLEISARTVETYRSRIMLKIQANSMAELVRLSISTGIVPLDVMD